MSEENVEIARGVRTQITVPSETRQRTVDEHILVRFPALVGVLASAWSRLSPRSRLRRAILSRYFRRAFEAVNRRDFQLFFLFLDPEVVFRYDESPVGGFVPPDLLGEHRGHEGYRRNWELADEAFADLRLELEEVIDYGDQVLTACHYLGHGRTSGITVNEPFFQVISLRRGLVIRQEDFADREKALEAAGLSE